jgi:hypothetical protein
LLHIKFKILYDRSMKKRKKNLIWLGFFLIGTVPLSIKYLVVGKVYEFGLREIAYWWIGGGIGVMFLWIDRVIDIYMGNTETELANYFKAEMNKGNYKNAFKILTKNKDKQERLVLRSILFQVLLAALVLMVITSSSASFGKGMLLGLCLALVLELTMMHKSDKNKLRRVVFWQINGEISASFLKKYIYSIWIIVGLLWVLAAITL